MTAASSPGCLLIRHPDAAPRASLRGLKRHLIRRTRYRKPSQWTADGQQFDRALYCAGVDRV
jgi:hypothetical protein